MIKSPKLFASVGFTWGIAAMITIKEKPAWNGIVVSLIYLVSCLLISHCLENAGE